MGLFSKKVNRKRTSDFYPDDIWTEVAGRYADRVPENFILYGEVIRWTGTDSPIQKNYTYDQEPGTNELYVYRVAVITNQGRVVDLPWDGVTAFCEEAGIKHVPVLWRGRHDNFTATDWIDVQLANIHANAIPLNLGKKFVDEGVCIRAEGKAPYILKAKSPIFLQHESAMLDEEAVDLESEGSVE